MEKQLTNQNYQVIPKQINNLSQTVTELNSNLSLIKPNNSQTVQLITYTLLATAIVGLFVYHYIKNQENNN